MNSQTATAPTRTGQTAVITGGARGIGAVVGRRLADEGARVLLVDLDPAVEATARELGEGAAAHVFDVTDPSAWVAAIGDAEVHTLVNCAGILGPARSAVDLPVEEFDRILRVNLTGTFVACQAVLPAMLAARRGDIVNMASIAGKEGNPGQAAYSASKGGVIALTKAIAREAAPAGVSVNCIAPTVVEGPFADSMDPGLREQILGKIPMGRFGSAAEVAALVAWIASPECAFTTGFCFDLSGGRATY